jgi:membrane-associated protein
MGIVDTFLHIDDKLNTLVQQYGPWVYGILFLVIFAETGFVVTPFLPGDSLLFAAGLLAHAEGGIQLHWLVIVLVSAAVLGDNTNYAIGRFLGPRIFKGDKARFFNKAHLDRTHAYFDKYGGKTLILARWMAFVRTFAPFVAGLGQMEYLKFLSYSVIGGSIWVVSLTTAGFLLADVPGVKEHLLYVIIGIVVLSIPLALFEVWKEKKRAKSEKTAVGEPPAENSENPQEVAVASHGSSRPGDEPPADA